MVRTLNLDGMFMPLIHPEIEHDLFKFPGGELHIKLNNNIDYEKITRVIITQRIASTDDFFAIAIAKDALERKGVRNFDLVLPYIPYGRQDRVAVEGESFTLEVFANFLNSLNFHTIYSIDPHSQITPLKINGFKEKPINNILMTLFTDIGNNLCLVVPDEGAVDRSRKIVSQFHEITSVVYGSKVRDPETGWLTDFKISVDDLGGRTCLVMDDICDGGGTFIGLGKKLKEHNAGKCLLYVTHGIFSKGFDELLKYYDHIYTTNSYKTITNEELVTQYKIQI